MALRDHLFPRRVLYVSQQQLLLLGKRRGRGKNREPLLPCQRGIFQSGVLKRRLLVPSPRMPPGASLRGRGLLLRGWGDRGALLLLWRIRSRLVDPHNAVR